MNFYKPLEWIFLAFGIVVFCANSPKAEDVSKDDLKKVEQKVLEQSLEHKKLQAQATQINLEMANVSRKMVSAARKIQDSEEKLSVMERQLKFLEDDLKDAQAGFSVQDENLIKTLAALQNLALRPTESLLVQPLTPVDIIRSAMILRETVPYLEENANRIRKQLQGIESKKKRIEQQIGEIAKQKNVLKIEYRQMDKMSKQKSALYKQIEKKSIDAKKKVDKLALQAQDLRDLLTKLEKQRQEAEKRRKDEERRKQEEKQHLDLIKSQPESITNMVSGFAKAKGKLPIPARGTIVTKYGEQKTKGVSAKGITIATRQGAQVISPFDGTVIFAGPFRGYGNMIIVEHGEGYLSLMSGLGNIDIELGQMLLAGEPVGKMANQPDTELYVEIRKNNQPINPAAWFKI